MKVWELTEDGRIVKGVNTTPDVGTNQIPIEASKFGNKVDKDGRPPTLSKKVKGKSTNVLFNLGLAESKISKETLNQLKMGIRQEMEHTNNPSEALKIAIDHVKEDPLYYDHMKFVDVEEKWSAKYKRSINCNNPKGFSQKAHCAGRKKKESKFTPMEWALMEGGHSIEDYYASEGKELASTSEIYVDMDGVLVDFFGEWAKLMNKDHFTDIDDVPAALQKIRDTDDFWLKIPKTSNADQLLNIIKQVKGSYKILSSPLADDPNSEPHKREWIKNNLKEFPPSDVIITHDKAAYAQNKDGTPNILIDDFGINIRKWTNAGGVGFKHKDHKFERTAKAIQQHMKQPVEEGSLTVPAGAFRDHVIGLIQDLDSRTDTATLAKIARILGKEVFFKKGKVVMQTPDFDFYKDKNESINEGLTSNLIKWFVSQGAKFTDDQVKQIEKIHNKYNWNKNQIDKLEAEMRVEYVPGNPHAKIRKHQAEIDRAKQDIIKIAKEAGAPLKEGVIKSTKEDLLAYKKIIGLAKKAYETNEIDPYFYDAVKITFNMNLYKKYPKLLSTLLKLGRKVSKEDWPMIVQDIKKNTGIDLTSHINEISAKDIGAGALAGLMALTPVSKAFGQDANTNPLPNKQTSTMVQKDVGGKQDLSKISVDQVKSQIEIKLADGKTVPVSMDDIQKAGSLDNFIKDSKSKIAKIYAGNGQDVPDWSMYYKGEKVRDVKYDQKDPAYKKGTIFKAHKQNLENRAKWEKAGKPLDKKILNAYIKAANAMKGKYASLKSTLRSWGQTLNAGDNSPYRGEIPDYKNYEYVDQALDAIGHPR